MWRYVAGGSAGLAAIGAGALLWTGSSAAPGGVLPPQPQAVAGSDPLPVLDRVPQASERTREEKRFGRYDKDRDGQITRDEYLASRRKAYARLDKDGDGRLSFDEWAVKATAKFATADRDRSGAMSAPEFATTAVKRKPARAAPCPPTTPAAEEG
ncbi:EF-hand domain-containing protein [Sphingomonas sp. 1P08PE]|uniref:EF-hand domain-containing protein n=1 Tax=Sphingomonas sp. 1P08PE TaxID=554122 RepID=UPI0039A24970